MRNANAGFSMIEMLVVVTLLALVAGSITFVMIKDNTTLLASGNDIAHQLRMTQLRAIRDGQTQQVEFDLSRNEINFADSVLRVPTEYSMTIKTTRDQVIDGDLVGISLHADASSSGGFILLESDLERFEINLAWISGKISTRIERKTS